MLPTNFRLDNRVSSVQGCTFVPEAQVTQAALGPDREAPLPSRASPYVDEPLCGLSRPPRILPPPGGKVAATTSPSNVLCVQTPSSTFHPQHRHVLHHRLSRFNSAPAVVIQPTSRLNCLLVP
ncbi:hypothetical protein EJ06DRAFT_124586 [Trichodelitschia bisporula]|uniref:Uncharacterized protein n=1 Tax=Trichodelitschia bisporula TaxID=703511 RepID=A0A6G1HQ50_9PEZI|nr:hypothetical protein EJ06DRAFT_124586 [Trichodelitschia bisporula]